MSKATEKQLREALQQLVADAEDRGNRLQVTQASVNKAKAALGIQKAVTANEDQELYVIPCGSGFTCLGFDVCERQIKALKAELHVSLNDAPRGTVERWRQLAYLQDVVHNYNRKNGFRSESELHPKLKGLEGKRIEARVNGETIRFRVGKSTGWIPCHLIVRGNSSGGEAISPADDVQVLRTL